MATTNTEFNLPQYGYLAFDPLTMKALIKERLNKSGIFTEQIIEGSYLSQLIDIFAYTFHTLIYYMNQTASEGSFTDTEAFENINRIVKALGYNPIGSQTSVVMFKAQYEGLSNDTIIIPRYSSVSINGYSYSLHDDITFIPNEKDDAGFLSNMGGKNILYQGTVKQNDLLTAEGTENEIFYLNQGEGIYIDHFTIDVYVKHEDEKWEKWEPTPSLYLNNASDRVYEIRLNEKNYYEIKFGNDICGKKLTEGDKIAIFYIESDGAEHEIGANALTNGTMSRYSNDLYETIMDDVRGDLQTSVISYNDIRRFVLSNTAASTEFDKKESVDSIKDNAPGIFRTQYRLVTNGDFENYIRTNFSTLIHDIKVLNNWEYVSKYLKYYYNLGLTRPTTSTQAVVNQVLFADSCNFNNVYIIGVPKVTTNDAVDVAYVPPALKSNILQSLQPVKVLTCEPVVVDPVYMAYGLCCPKNIDELTINDIEKTELHIRISTTSKINPNITKTKVADAIKDYFSKKNCVLGQKISTLQLQSNILSLDGIDAIYMINTEKPNVRLNNLSFLKFNEIYPNDKTQIVQDDQLEDFQFPYLYKGNLLLEHIIIDDYEVNITTAEY